MRGRRRRWRWLTVPTGRRVTCGPVTAPRPRPRPDVDPQRLGPACGQRGWIRARAHWPSTQRSKSSSTTSARPARKCAGSVNSPGDRLHTPLFEAIERAMKKAPGEFSGGLLASSGDRIRTCDLWVMSPASYRAAPPRVGEYNVTQRCRMRQIVWSDRVFGRACRTPPDRKLPNSRRNWAVL